MPVKSYLALILSTVCSTKTYYLQACISRAKRYLEPSIYSNKATLFSITAAGHIPKRLQHLSERHQNLTAPNDDGKHHKA